MWLFEFKLIKKGIEPKKIRDSIKISIQQFPVKNYFKRQKLRTM